MPHPPSWLVPIKHCQDATDNTHAITRSRRDLPTQAGAQEDDGEERIKAHAVRTKGERVWRAGTFRWKDVNDGR